MRLEMVVPSEPLMALLALEGLLSRVGSLVVLQHMLVTERPVTDTAHEQLVAVRAATFTTFRRPARGTSRRGASIA